MATINMILQGKGGVGKSLVASVLTQHLKESGKKLFCVDTDPINATFAGYKEFEVTTLEIMKDNDINPREFDVLAELMMTLPEDSEMVIDNGAATFVPLASYLVENDAFEMLEEAGHQVNLHTVVTGGQALTDTLTGLEALLKAFDTPIYVWLNSYFGEIKHNGKNFEEFKVYTNYIDRFAALIRIPQKKKETFGKDFENLLTARLSFQEGIEGEFPLMTRQRLRMMWTQFSAELKKSGL